MVTVDELIDCIRRHQSVLNEDTLSLDDRRRLVLKTASLDVADENSLAFLANARYQKDLLNTKAAVVLVDKKNFCHVPKSALAVVVPSPYLAYASVSELFAYKPFYKGIHPSAVVASTACIAKTAQIGANAVIGEHVFVGENSQIGANAVIGDGVQIGHETLIDHGARVAHHCDIGDYCRIHTGAVIGAEGFGFAPIGNPTDTGWQRIAQLGRVVVGNRVRVGANTCIDRGAIADTVIGDDVIIDNLVQIAHNVVIGQGTAIAAGTGIAGSTVIGKGCVIGGMVGIAGHLSIADNVTITAMTCVIKSITQEGSYSSGTTAMPSDNWRRAAVRFRKLGNK